MKQYLYLVCAIAIMLSCKRVQNNSDNFSRQINEKYLDATKFLEGKSVSSIKKILSDSLPDGKDFIVLYYDGRDCSSCIDIGFNLIKRVKNFNRSVCCFVIANNARISQDQFNNSYKNYVFNDEFELIRKQLNFIYSPVVLRINKDLLIENIWFINNGLNEEEFDPAILFHKVISN
jgi:hypothetical protein